MAIPKLNAFWRVAPAVLFIAFEILATGVLLFECALRSRTCSFVQAIRLVRPLFFFRLIAIRFSPFRIANYHGDVMTNVPYDARSAGPTLFVLVIEARWRLYL